MSMAKRKRFTATTKASILKQHLQKKSPISELCVEHGCTPGSVYQWQETMFSRAHQLFEMSANRVGRPRDEVLREQKMVELEKKLVAKNAVISELMEEILKEKKLAGVI